MYYHSTIPAESLTLEVIKNAKEKYLRKQSRVYCEVTASLLVEQIDEELNNVNNNHTITTRDSHVRDAITGIDDCHDYDDNDNNSSSNGFSKGIGAGGSNMKSNIRDLRDHSKYGISSSKGEGNHSGPGFLKPTKNSTAGRVPKVITNSFGSG